MGQIPFIVLFNVVVSQTQGEQCGGSILDETHILTAAHCVFSDDGTVIKANQAFIAAGIIGNDPPESAFVQVAQVIPHENFVPANDSNQNDPNALVNDLAILKLAKPLTFSNSVQPVKIGTNPYKVGTKFTVAGWGVNNINKPKQVSQSLLETTVTSGDVSSCKQVEPDYSGPNGRQICTVDATDSSCSGDSGGPLFLQQNGVNVLAGLVSFGAQTSDSAPICGSLDTLSYYTNVYYYRDWIAQKMGVSASRLLATNSTTGTSPSSSAGSDSGSGSGSSSSSSIQSSSASFSVAAASAIFIAAATALF
ncbi:trypsin-like serine protease [Ramicandelaber brevisporus]|nr:trypsin-like serine protease [Ramicandelaber brevisporus]